MGMILALHISAVVIRRIVRDLHSRETGVKIKADLSFISVSGHEVYIKEALLILRKRRSVRRIG